MRVVIALGGNALLRRGEPMTVGAQRTNVRVACEALAPIALDHQLVISHGNGPQVGLLALQSAAYQAAELTPLDVLGAQSEGMIGYLVEQELGNVLPFEKEIATVLTMTEVDPDDPAFADPTKPIGPVYARAEADALSEEKGWAMRPDGDGWRRVVPSPRPRRVFELGAIRLLMDHGVTVICAGGGGIPTMYAKDRERYLMGTEAVIDKDLSSALLARELAADVLVMATDVAAVHLDHGTPRSRAIRRATPDRLDVRGFAAGSMGPKVTAACEFVEATGGRAVIGALEDLQRMVAGTGGTQVPPGRGVLDTDPIPRDT